MKQIQQIDNTEYSPAKRKKPVILISNTKKEVSLASVIGCLKRSGFSTTDIDKFTKEALVGALDFGSLSRVISDWVIIRTVMILLVIFIGYGCYSPADDYILDHTEYECYDEMEEGYRVDFFVEEKDDICISQVHSHDLLATQKVLCELTNFEYEPIKTVTIWIPHDIDSWNEFNGIRSYWSDEYNHISSTIFISGDIDDFVLVVNPNIWFEKDRCFILLNVYLKELVYYLDYYSSDYFDYFGKDWLLTTAWDILYDELNLSCERNIV